MVPTKRGIAMLVVGVVLYGLAWQTQIGWFYVADALVVAIFAVNMPLPWLAMRGLSAVRTVVARQQSSGDLFEGDAIAIATTLHNGSLVPKSLITLDETCPLAGPEEREHGFLIAAIALLRAALLPKKRVVMCVGDTL